MKRLLSILILLPIFSIAQREVVDSMTVVANTGQVIRFTQTNWYATAEADDSIFVRNTRTKKRALISQLSLPISTATAAALLLKANTSSIPTTTSQLTNNSGFITGITSGNVTTALGFTPYNATNPSGYISSVPAQTFASLTGKPTTLLGYGITDAITAATAASTYQPVGSYLTAASLVPYSTTAQANALYQPIGSGGAPAFINLAANFSNATVTQTPVTGWTIPVVAGKTYRIEIIAEYQTAALTTGGTIGYYMLTGAGTIRGTIEGDIAQTAVATGLKIPVRVCTTIGAVGSSLTTSAVGVINSPHGISSRVTFTCTSSGNLQVGWASEVAASAAQLNANSTLLYQALN